MTPQEYILMNKMGVLDLVSYPYTSLPQPITPESIESLIEFYIRVIHLAPEYFFLDTELSYIQVNDFFGFNNRRIFLSAILPEYEKPTIFWGEVTHRIIKNKPLLKLKLFNNFTQLKNIPYIRVYEKDSEDGSGHKLFRQQDKP